MTTLELNALVCRKAQLEGELSRLVDQRSSLETQVERLELIPEAVRITGAISDIERMISWQSLGFSSSQLTAIGDAYVLEARFAKKVAGWLPQSDD